MANRIHIETINMRQLEQDFDRLGSEEPYRYAHERLDVALENLFQHTQRLVPVGKGDRRRPSGSLKNSGRTTSSSAGVNEWTGDIAYGTNDDELPYAVWARWKHFHKTGIDYMAPTDDSDDTIGEAMNAAWDDVFHGEV